MSDTNKDTRIFHIIVAVLSLFSANVVGSIVLHYCKMYFGILKNNSNILKEFVFRTISGYVVLFISVVVFMIIITIISRILDKRKNLRT